MTRWGYSNTKAISKTVLEEKASSAMLIGRPLPASSAPVQDLPTPFGAPGLIKLTMAYADAVHGAGGQPVVSPARADMFVAFHGLTSTAGGDVDPRPYGESSNRRSLALTTIATELSVCPAPAQMAATISSSSPPSPRSSAAPRFAISKMKET